MMLKLLLLEYREFKMEKMRGLRMSDQLYKRICKADPTGKGRFTNGLRFIIKVFFDSNP